jgi:hypothetical protein
MLSAKSEQHGPIQVGEVLLHEGITFGVSGDIDLGLSIAKLTDLWLFNGCFLMRVSR